MKTVHSSVRGVLFGVFVVVGVLWLGACTTEATRKSSPEGAPTGVGDPREEGQPWLTFEAQGGPGDGHETSKSTAPVEIGAEVGEGGATLSVKFLTDADDVQIKVWGIQGLEVRGDGLLSDKGVFRRGEVGSFQIVFVAPSTPCNLAIGVSGRFAERVRSTVRTFSIPSTAETSSDSVDIRQDEQGRPITIIR